MTIKEPFFTEKDFDMIPSDLPVSTYVLIISNNKVAPLLTELESLRDKLKSAREVIEWYAQKPKPDITSEFAKGAMEFGETHTVTWEPLIDLGERAREWLQKEKD